MSTILSIILKAIVLAIATAGVIVIAAILFAFPIMWLWNYTVPFIRPGTPELDFWHALTLGMLCGSLFKASVTTKSKSS
jgi:hypothetical protein